MLRALRSFVPDSLRSRYALKLLAISLVIVVVIVAIGTTMALQVSDRVTDEQVQAVNANAELEAKELANWFEGEQEWVRVLSSHRGIDPADESLTRSTLETKLEQRSSELASLHVAERATDHPSNGTTEEIVYSSDPVVEGGTLADANVDWGEDTDGSELQYAFDDVSDILVSWVYLDDGDMTVAIGSPTADGAHVLVAEYHPSERVEESTHVVEGTNTVVLGGVSAYVMFDEGGPDEFYEYKGDRESTEVGQAILDREDQFAPLSGSELADDEVRGYHSVDSEGVNWVVVNEAPRENALAVTDQVQSDLATLIGVVIVGFLLIGVVIQAGPIRSIKHLSGQANALSAGDLSVEIEASGRIDEVGQLTESFRNTKAYIETITRQSEKLARQEFDAEVLYEDIPGAVGTSMVTMREDLERFITQLEAERNRYSALVEQSSDGVVVLRDGEVRFANERTAEITGYDPAGLAGRAFQDLVHPEDRSLVETVVDEVSQRETASRYRLGLETADGEQRVVELSATAIDHDGAPATLLTIRDVTQRERREQRLEVFNRVLRHNLRNDLQVIVPVLDDLAAGETPDEDTVRLAHETVDDLLATAQTARRIERAFETLEIQAFDLGALLDSIEYRIHESYPGATVEGVGSTATVEAASVLEAALWELVENALEHTDDHPHVSFDLEVRDDVAVLSIADTGPGLPRIERETIRRGTESELLHANGLGLWLAHWTVEASRGSISFDVGDGTVVRVTLPLADTGDDGGVDDAS